MKEYKVKLDIWGIDSDIHMRLPLDSNDLDVLKDIKEYYSLFTIHNFSVWTKNNGTAYLKLFYKGKELTRLDITPRLYRYFNTMKHNPIFTIENLLKVTEGK